MKQQAHAIYKHFGEEKQRLKAKEDLYRDWETDRKSVV